MHTLTKHSKRSQKLMCSYVSHSPSACVIIAFQNVFLTPLFLLLCTLWSGCLDDGEPSSFHARLTVCVCVCVCELSPASGRGQAGGEEGRAGGGQGHPHEGTGTAAEGGKTQRAERRATERPS